MTLERYIKLCWI